MLFDNGQPELFLRDSNIREYLVMEKVPVVVVDGVKYDAEAFLKNKITDPELRLIMKERLEVLAKRLAPFKRIEDASWSNVVWTGSDWILIDWLIDITEAKKRFDPTVFNSKKWKSVRGELSHLIYLEREKIFMRKRNCPSVLFNP